MMKTKRNRWIRKMIGMMCVFSFLCPVLTVRADDLESLESRSSGLQSELSNINEELLKIGEQIAENEVELEAVNNDIIRTEEQLQIARNNEDAHYDDMKIRIQYIYENGGETLLGMILSSTSLSEMVNRVYFVQKMSEYDRGMFDELKDLRCTIEDEEGHLKKQKESYQNLEKELNVKKEELSVKAAETSTDLETVQAAISRLKAEQMASQTAWTNAAAGGSSNENAGGGNNESAGGGSTNTDPMENNQEASNGGTDNSDNSSGGGYVYPSGPGQLNPWIGVVYYNGHRETYYSQRVLPGGGLSIPGRHVASDGTIRDANGYICVASSDYPKGTVVETSLGTAMVYDTGCASGTIDIYTDW